MENPHTKRRERTRRRMTAIGTVLYAVLKYAELQAEGLSHEQCMERLKDMPQLPGAMTPAELSAVLDEVRVGQRRTKSRRPSAQWKGSNQELMRAVKLYEPNLLGSSRPLTEKRLGSLMAAS